MVVLPVDAPSSVGDNPQGTALPFEPVQPTQQRFAMQASPQTSGFTSGQSIIHDVPAPPPPARTVVVGDITLREGPTAGGEPRDTVGETPTENDVETVPLNPPGWMPRVTGPTPRLRAAQVEVMSRWTDPSNWEGYEEWSANQWRPLTQAEAMQEADEFNQRQRRSAQAWQEWVNRDRNFDRWYPRTSTWRGREWTFHEHGKGGRSGDERQEEGRYFDTQSFYRGGRRGGKKGGKGSGKGGRGK